MKNELLDFFATAEAARTNDFDTAYAYFCKAFSKFKPQEFNEMLTCYEADELKKNRAVVDAYVAPEGYIVTVYKPRKARKSERTWLGNSKYSVSTLGAQAAKNGRRGAISTPDVAGV